LKTVIRKIAEGGYDGIFIDNNILHCHCESCQDEFKKYMRETYTLEQLVARFGTDDIEPLKLSERGDQILWARESLSISSVSMTTNQRISGESSVPIL
jgi:hypothetical protein